jgi:hypothetical protein
VQQVEDYALDLRDFHEASHNLTILPILCATNAPDGRWTVSDVQGVADTALCDDRTVVQVLTNIGGRPSGRQIDLEVWEQSPYRPVPSIIEAAELLYAGHEVREIAHATADPENLGATTDRLIEIIAEARRRSQHVVAFITGVPGALIPLFDHDPVGECVA